MFTKQDLLHQRHTIDKLRNQSVLTPQHAEKIEQIAVATRGLSCGELQGLINNLKTDTYGGS